MTQEHLQIEDWTFSAVPREKGRFGPDIRVSRGAETATVWLNETGFHSDNKALTGSMPPQVDDAYQGYLLGAVDGYEQTKRCNHSQKSDEWQETGNEIAHSAQESSGWRIKGLVRGDNPPAFKVQVKAADGHVTDMAFDAQSAITATSTGKRALPESVKQVAEAMLAGQRDGARVARNRPVSLAEREEARRNAASSAERSR